MTRVAPVAAGIVIATGLVLVTIGLGRDPAFERLIGSDALAGLRADLLPVTWKIAAENFPWGTGVGSFDDVYRMYEPDALLMPEYVNHAHNDFLELLMTGGMAAVLIMTFAIVVFAARAWAIFRGGFAEIRANIWPTAALIALTVLFIASLIDYPLRTPAMASYGFARDLDQQLTEHCDILTTELGNYARISGTTIWRSVDPPIRCPAAP